MKLIPEKEVKKVVLTLEKEKVVALPTDTVYGFFANAFSEKGVKKIFEIKKRKINEPIGIFIARIKKAKKYARIGEKEEEFLEKYLPGQVTFILEKRVPFPKGVGTKSTIGIRIPEHPLFRDLFTKIDFPLAQTSANVSGEKTLKKGEEIFERFKKRPLGPDLVLEGSTPSGVKPSTVVDLSSSYPKIIREGSVEVEL